VPREATSDEFPQAEHWLNNFIANATVRFEISPKKAAMNFAVIRRTQLAIYDHDQACEYLASFVGALPQWNISLYFRCLSRFESSLPICA
jgi:hypothetical protein